MSQFGDYYVRFESIPADFDDAELLKGLPNDACPCAHWGYLFKGRMRFRYTDGSEDVVSAGEAYYARPGHTFETLENCETVEFSPKCSMTPAGPPRRHENEVPPRLFSRRCLEEGFSELRLCCVLGSWASVYSISGAYDGGISLSSSPRSSGLENMGQ
jgi:hypothetical protein